MAPNRVEALASALYGVVLATAITAAYSESPELSDLQIAYAVLATAIVFWLAHVYVGALARGILRGERSGWAAAKQELVEEATIVAGALPIAAALCLAPIGLLSEQQAETAALAIGIGLLTLGGLAAGLREDAGLLRITVLTAISLGLGLAIVGLKAAAH